MKLLLFSIIILCLLEAQWTTAASVRLVQTDLFLDCSQYANDYDVILSFPYVVHIDPIFQYPAKTTYASMNKDGNIYQINIVNQDSVPPIIYCLKYLQKLDIRNTSFCDSEQQLPADIEHFEPSLIHLGIYDTIITHLPKQIGKLTRLKSLELSNTGLTFLPNTLGDLSSLTHLLLPDNKLTSLPTTMTNLRSLRQITLNNNPHLRSIQALNGLPSLKLLQTDHCPIEHLPLNLPNLIDLYMSDNNLTNLVGIQTLGSGTSNKKSFYFNRNHIRFIPSEILYVHNLYQFNMNDNELTNLPSDIFNIPTLRYFRIRNNRFRRSELKEITLKFKKINPDLQLTY